MVGDDGDPDQCPEAWGSGACTRMEAYRFSQKVKNAKRCING
jgi:hypothetical protein